MLDDKLNSEQLVTENEEKVDSVKEDISEVKEEAPKKVTTKKVIETPKEEAPIEEQVDDDIDNLPDELPGESAAIASAEVMTEEIQEQVIEGISKAKPVETEGIPSDLDAVETERQSIQKYYKKQNRWSYAIMIAVLVFVIVGFILVIVQSSYESGLWMMILGYVLIGIGIVGMILQYIFNRRRLPKRVDEYAAKAIDVFNAFNYSNKAYSNVYYDELEKVEPSEILADRCYYNVNDTKSQAVVRGSFSGAVFKSANVCVLVPGDKKKSQSTVFLGRYITYPNTLKLENRIILNYKGVKPIDLPTDVMDLEKLEDSDLFTVYGVEGTNYRSVLPAKFLTALSKINVSGSLLNMNVVIWQGHSAVYLTYVDEFVSIPYQEPINKEYYEKGRDDIYNVLSALKLINK